jgi:hypothetical protein
MPIMPLRLTDGVLFIDNSSFSLIMECQRKAGLGLSLKRKANKDESALNFGKIMHKSLEYRYATVGSGFVTADVEAKMVQVLADGFSQHTPPEGDFRTLDQAVACIEAYNLRYPQEDFEILEVNGHCGTETPFAIPLCELEVNDTIWVQDVNDPEPREVYIRNLPIVFTGRIDLNIQDALGIWVFDHKTTSIGGANFFAEFYTATQFKGYCWATKQLTGRMPSGAIINGLINRRPTRTGKSIEFIRDHVNLDATVIDEWFHTFTAGINQYIHSIKHQQFPMSTTSCISKYGRCEFYNVCSLPVGQRELMLRSGEYTDRTWDPILEEEDKVATPYMP